MFFVDTGAWLSILFEKDEYHQSSLLFLKDLKSKQSPLLTSNYILDETYTLILIKIGYQAVLKFYRDILNLQQTGVLQLVQVMEGIQEKAWEIFVRFNKDKKWSFTDCTSKAIMDQLRLTQIFSFDSNFDQMGFVRYPLEK